MNKLWKQIAARVNALALRERFLLFICLIGLIGLGTDLLFIAPLRAQQKLLVAQLEQKSSSMDSQRAEINLEMLRRGRDRATELNAEIRKMKGDIDAIDREVAALSAPADSMSAAAMMARIIKGNDKVTLVRIMQATPGAVAIASNAVVPPPRNVLDVTFAGGFADLTHYLAALEKAIPQVRWGGLWLKADSTPAQVSVRLILPPGGK